MLNECAVSIDVYYFAGPSHREHVGVILRHDCRVVQDAQER